MNRDEWGDFATSHVRRLEADRSEPWHEEALDIARQLEALLRSNPSPVDAWCDLLTRAGRLPAGETDAQLLRRHLLRAALDLTSSPPLGPPIQAGSLIVEPYGGLAIVTREAKAPPPSWLAKQDYEPMRQHATSPWWSALTFKGGSILVVDALTFVVGAPTDEQLRDLVERTSVRGARQLLELFPRLMDRL